MSRSSIEWLHRPGTLPESWNFVTGCNKVDRGCKHCYAEIMHRRLQFMYPKKYDHDFLTGAHVHEELLQLPFSWKKPCTVFVNSMSDLFHENVPFDTILHAWAIMLATQQHTYIIATKRVERAREYFDWLAKESEPMQKKYAMYREYICPEERVKLLMRERFGIDVIRSAVYPSKNIWLLASVNDQASANLRIPVLITLPVKVKGISAEPLTGPIDIEAIVAPRAENHSANGKSLGLKKIHHLAWIIAGGESGGKASALSPWWLRNLRDQAKDAEVPFFFKQWGEYIPNSQYEGPELKANRYKWVNSATGKMTPAIGHWNETEMLQHQDQVIRMGKKAAGRVLDGKTHDGFPFGETYDDLPF